MSNNKKFVVKNGLQTQNADFVSPNEANTIAVSMLDTDTLSISGNSGQLFSITDSLSGTIFAVNDISGVPSIEVYDTGKIQLAETFGNVLIGTAIDNGTDKLQVNGSVSTPIYKQVQGAVSASTATTDLNFNIYGNFYVTLSANTAFTFSNLATNIGSSGYIFLKQDATGGRTFTLPAAAKTPGGRTITQTTTANSLSMITFYVVDASTVIVNYIADFK